jgi:hypothetical protein
VPDSDAVRQARYRATAKGRAAAARHHAKNNPRRIFVCNTYIGTENAYPAPREAVAQLARELIERHRKELP